jgi:hypothetical protein
MPAEISNVQGGTVTLRVSGRLTQQELAAAQARTAGVIGASGGGIRILVLVEDFDGWEKDGQWSDFSFQEAHDAHIARMAIVGEEQWRDLTLLFTSQGLRPFPIEFFPAARLAAARAWLEGA